MAVCCQKQLREERESGSFASLQCRCDREQMFTVIA